MSNAERLQALAENRYWSEVEAREALEFADASGLELSEFAERHGLKLDRLKRWRRRLGSATPQLVRVELKPALDEGDLDERDKVMIMLDNGTWLEVPAGFPVEHLRAILGVLREC